MIGKLGYLFGNFFRRLKKIKFIPQNFLLAIIFLLTVLSFISLQNQKELRTLVDHQSAELSILTDLLNSVKNNQFNNSSAITPTVPVAVPTAITTPSIPTPPAQVLGDSTIQPQNYKGILQVKDNTTANIYQNPSIDSIIITTVSPKSFLFFYEKNNNWYKVELVDSSQIGWVNQENIVEFNNE